MRIFRVLLLATGVLLVGYVGYRLLAATDTQRIARVLEKTRQGIVRRDLNLVMSGVDRSYEDDFGQDYARLFRRLEHLFHAYDSITCFLPRERILVQRPEASCTLTFWAAGYNRSGQGSQSADDFPIYSDQVVVYLHKFDTGWRIISASP